MPGRRGVRYEGYRLVWRFLIAEMVFGWLQEAAFWRKGHDPEQTLLRILW